MIILYCYNTFFKSYTMNYNKINKTIELQHAQQLEKILSNISIHYKINKKELFNQFLYKNNNIKVYKNKKKILDPEYKCMGRKQDSTQCSRGRKFGDYCGKHNPPKFGRIDEPLDESLFKKKKKHIMVKTEHINNKQFIIEEATNIVFDADIANPTVIGKKLTDNKILFLSEMQTEQPVYIDEEVNILNILSKLSNKGSTTIEKEYTEFNPHSTEPVNKKNDDFDESKNSKNSSDNSSNETAICNY